MRAVLAAAWVTVAVWLSDGSGVAVGQISQYNVTRQSVPVTQVLPNQTLGPRPTLAGDRRTLGSPRIWQRLATSVEGRPIEFAQFGRGPRNMLVVGPLAGDQSAAVGLIDRLAIHLAHFPQQLSGAAVTLVRSLNPDGYVHHTATNAHGVDLNRNFAARDWRKVPRDGRWLSGRVPLSEPESRALTDLIEDVGAERVIVLCAARPESSLIAAPRSENLARRVSQMSGIPLAESNEAGLSGSLQGWVGADLSIECVTLCVPRHDTPETLWTAHRTTLLALLQITTPPSATSPLAGNPRFDRTSQTTESPPLANPLDSPLPTANPPTNIATESSNVVEDWHRRTSAQRTGDRQETITKSQAIPRRLSADELTADAPMVAVIKPRAPRRAGPSTSPSLTQNVPRGATRGPSWLHPGIRRLPPVEPRRPTIGRPYPKPVVRLPRVPESRHDSRWPQAPIPLYPGPSDLEGPPRGAVLPR